MARRSHVLRVFRIWTELIKRNNQLLSDSIRKGSARVGNNVRVKKNNEKSVKMSFVMKGQEGSRSYCLVTTPEFTLQSNDHSINWRKGFDGQSIRKLNIRHGSTLKRGITLGF